MTLSIISLTERRRHRGIAQLAKVIRDVHTAFFASLSSFDDGLTWLHTVIRPISTGRTSTGRSPTRILSLIIALRPTRSRSSQSSIRGTK